MATATWDTVIRNALVFDGTGAMPEQIDLAIRDGRVAAKGRDLPAEMAARVIDGTGQWLMPGLLDIHTHLDLKVDLDPRLPEVVRHGTTTVLVGNCSLGTCFGKQRAGEQAVAPRAARSFPGIAALLNSRLFKGNIHFQALGTNFRIWSDGIVSPLYEELDSTCQLIAREYDDAEGRKALLNDPRWVESFRHDWHHGRQGNNLATWKARLGLPDHLVIRDLYLLTFDGAPVPEWEGETMQQVYDRAQHYLRGNPDQARSDAEREAFEQFPRPLGDDADFMLHLLRTYDNGFRFWADVGNVGNRSTLDLLLHKNTLPGFNDPGAHITNMAFFDANLMSLKLADERGLNTVSAMVRRLTREPAAFFGLDVGTLEVGAQADITMIDPEALKSWRCDQTRRLEYRELFEHQQMVNRPEGIVSHVLINGESVWQDGDFTDVLGSRPLGRALRAA